MVGVRRLVMVVVGVLASSASRSEATPSDVVAEGGEDLPQGSFCFLFDSFAVRGGVGLILEVVPRVLLVMDTGNMGVL